MITLRPGSLILGNAVKLPDLPESLKIPGSRLKLSSDPIGQGERPIGQGERITCAM